MVALPGTANSPFPSIGPSEDDAVGLGMSDGARAAAQSFWRLVNVHFDAFALLGRNEGSCGGTSRARLRPLGESGASHLRGIPQR
jgi:hypothetical protein